VQCIHFALYNAYVYSTGYNFTLALCYIINALLAPLTVRLPMIQGLHAPCNVTLFLETNTSLKPHKLIHLGFYFLTVVGMFSLCWILFAFYISIDSTSMWCNCSSHKAVREASSFLLCASCKFCGTRSNIQWRTPKKKVSFVCAVHFVEVFNPVPSITILFVPHPNYQTQKMKRMVYCVWNE